MVRLALEGDLLIVPTPFLCAVPSALVVVVEAATQLRPFRGIATPTWARGPFPFQV